MSVESTFRGRKRGRPYISEADFQATIIAIARYHGWFVSHFRAVQTRSGWLTPVAADGKGFPDLVLCRERMIYAELKADKGSLKPEQKVWRDKLESAGAEYYLWRPRLIDEIERVLK